MMKSCKTLLLAPKQKILLFFVHLYMKVHELQYSVHHPTTAFILNLSLNLHHCLDNFSFMFVRAAMSLVTTQMST